MSYEINRVATGRRVLLGPSSSSFPSSSSSSSFVLHSSPTPRSVFLLFRAVLPTIGSMSMPAAAAAAPTSSHCVASSLASMLEKEQSIYRRCPPNPNVPLAEYSKDRSLLVSWCQKLVYKKGDFRSPDELVQTVSASRSPLLGFSSVYR